MISLIFVVGVLLASMYSFVSHKHALLFILLVGFLQDTVRKLTPGEPVYFILSVGVLFLAVLLGFWLRRGFNRSLEPFLTWTDKLRDPMLIFVLILFAQFAYSILQYGNLMVATIGLAAYLAPFLAIMVGYAVTNSIEGIRAFCKLYVLAGCLVAVSVFASFFGIEATILNEVGVGLKIYDQGTVLRSHSGLMRTGEIAAWHMSTAACLLVMLLLTSTSVRSYLVPVAIVGLLLVAVMLTGRRKMLMMTTLFLAGYFTSLLYYRKTLNARYFASFVMLIVAAWLGFEFINLGDYNEGLRNYLARGTSVFSDASGRFMQLGIAPVHWAYNRVGLLGGGLGIASQGSYMFGSTDVAGGAGEGGLGKIMVELGLPGLLCIAWLVYVIARYVDRSLRLSLLPGVDSRLLPLMLSLTVFLAGNAVTFSVATQVYGDLFILIMLGLVSGFVFALPKLAADSLRASAIRHQPAQQIA